MQYFTDGNHLHHQQNKDFIAKIPKTFFPLVHTRETQENSMVASS
jgi:hypothetical protein